MHLAKLELKSFRNYESFDGEFTADVQVIVGDNAQGKTNLLEAIHYLSALRSFRATRAAEMIRFGDEAARVRGVVSSPAGADVLVVTTTLEGRKSTVNGKDAFKFTSYTGYDAASIDFQTILESIRFE